MKVLHIIGSPRGERSRSRDVAGHFLDALDGAEVSEFDIWAETLPELDGSMIESRYRLINGLPVDPAFAAQWQALRVMVDHLLSFDLWLFSTPMWNLGLPYRLKHYVDCLIQPTMAFTNDSSGAVTCHGAGKIAVIVGAGALDTRPGGPLEALDYTVAHLAQCLRMYFGLDQVHDIRVMPTFGSEEDVAARMEQARAEARRLALTLLASAGGRD